MDQPQPTLTSLRQRLHAGYASLYRLARSGTLTIPQLFQVRDFLDVRSRELWAYEITSLVFTGARVEQPTIDLAPIFSDLLRLEDQIGLMVVEREARAAVSQPKDGRQD